MCDIVDLVLVDKLLCDDPGCVGDDLVDPATVPHTLATLGVGHDGWGLVFFDEGVGSDANNEMDDRERQFGLAKLEGMAGRNFNTAKHKI